MPDCTKCGNRNNDYCIFACENGESFKPITNADRIRAMTDEELVSFFGDVLADWANAFDGGSLKYPYDVGAWLAWLRQEATDG